MHSSVSISKTLSVITHGSWFGPPESAFSVIPAFLDLAAFFTGNHEIAVAARNELGPKDFFYTNSVMSSRFLATHSRLWVKQSASQHPY